MKKKLVPVVLLCAAFVSGCGKTVPQETYDALNESYQEAVKERDSYKAELDALNETETISERDLRIAECKAAAASDLIGLKSVMTEAKMYLKTLDTSQWESDIEELYNQHIQALDNIKSTYGIVDLLKEQGQEVDEAAKMDEILAIVDKTKKAWDDYRDGIYSVFTSEN